MIDSAKEEGFELKATTAGLTFIPIDEEEKDEIILESEDEDFIERMAKLKDGAEDILAEQKKG